MEQKDYISHKTGFMLLEAIIAMALLALALGGALISLTVARRSINTSQIRTEALHTARGVLEQLRTQAWNSSELQPGTYAFNTNGYIGTYVVSTRDTNLRDITINLNWTNTWSGQADILLLETTLASSLH